MKTRIYTICIALLTSILIPVRSNAAEISLDIYINSNGDAYYDTGYYESDETAARILTDRVASIVRLSAYEWERLFEFYLDEIRYSRGGIMERGFTTREDLFIRHLLRAYDYRLWRNYVARRVRMTPPPPPVRHVPAPAPPRHAPAPAPRHNPAPAPAPRGNARPAPAPGNGGGPGHNAGPGGGHGNYDRGPSGGGSHNGGGPSRGGNPGGSHNNGGPGRGGNPGGSHGGGHGGPGNNSGHGPRH